MRLNAAGQSAIKHLAIGAAIVATLYFGATYGAAHGWLPANIGKILAPSKANIPDVQDAQVQNVVPAPYPSTAPANINKPQIRAEIWEWNAQMGMILANGGNSTTKGSLMEKHNVNLLLTRQDDTNQMVKDLVSCAKEIHDGATQCSSGANVIDIMGDQSAEVAAQANPLLKKLGPDYALKLIGSVGYSRGEDACMLPHLFDPKNISATVMKGADETEIATHGVLIAGSIHEGDWNICMKYAGDNAIPNNPDITTFDAEAFNWMSEPDYNTAAADYVAGKCEDRKEVSKGKLTGRKVSVCINGVASWTPADVTVALKRGGLDKKADSLMYRGQMPSVIIGSGHFINQNRDQFKDMLRASWDGGDQIKAFPEALTKAAQISAKVYNDEGDSSFHNGAYWAHYFHPVQQKDKTGQVVSLGGSAVNNLQDNVILFGLDGSNNNMATDFTVFRNINLQQYPQQYKPDGETPLPLAKEVIDSSLVQDIWNDARNGDSSEVGASADTQDFSKSGSGDVVSNRGYAINFANGSAEPLPDSMVVLASIKDSAAITGLKIKIDGFTDNTGNPTANISLSEARAQAVKSYLQKVAAKNFPNNRFVSVEGHGQDNPVADNSTATGKAKNRRVEVSLIQ